MSEKRIGKLERWILIHIYKKSMNELPKGWKELEEYKPGPINKRNPWAQTAEDVADQNEEIKRTCLNKDEIFLNYFDNLELSTMVTHGGGDLKECFRTTKQYKSALVILSRTIKRMMEKGLIEIIQGMYITWTFIKLTHIGKLVAERYL